MKKTINFLIFFAIMISITYFLWSNPDITNKLGNTMYDIYDNITKEDVEEYTNNFKINDMQISNSTFYYDNLSKEQKYIYSAFAISVKNLDSKVLLKDYDSEDKDEISSDVDAAITAFFNDHPEVFYVDNSYSISTATSFFGTKKEININFLVSGRSDLDSKIEILKAEIENILSKAKDLQGIDAQIAIHDELMKDTRYHEYNNIEELPVNTHNIYGTLVDKKAVCDGFAKTMQILLDKVSIESIIVTGSLEDEAHAWNLVKLDGAWYNLDFTSNKSVKTINLGEQVGIHSYFNITTDEISKTHIIDNKYNYPVADETKYNYYIYNKKYISSVDDFSTSFKKILNSNKNTSLAEVKVTGISNVPDKMINVLQNKNYSEYSLGNKITYYKILDTYIIMKNN